MMKKVIIPKEKMYSGRLILVNAEHPLKEIGKTELIPAFCNFPDILLERSAADMLSLILEKISAKEQIVPVSGFRTTKEQVKIYEESLKDNGKDFTEKYVALPDHSEHQTGLAIDLALNKEEIDFIRPDFPYDGICNQFRKEAGYYGFVERYAKTKEKITQIAQEPWHFRYVGYPHSRIMCERGLSLEEYTEFVKSYRMGCELTFECAEGFAADIYYAPMSENGTEIQIPENAVYQISGNNVDGFVVTVWRKRDGKESILYRN